MVLSNHAITRPVQVNLCYFIYIYTVRDPKEKKKGEARCVVALSSPHHSLWNNVRIVIWSWQRAETFYAAKRQKQNEDQYVFFFLFLSQGKSFLTFGGVPCRTITQNGTGPH